MSENVWATSDPDIGRIKNAEPIRIQIDVAKPLPKFPP